MIKSIQVITFRDKVGMGEKKKKKRKNTQQQLYNLIFVKTKKSLMWLFNSFAIYVRREKRTEICSKHLFEQRETTYVTIKREGSSSRERHQCHKFPFSFFFFVFLAVVGVSVFWGYGVVLCVSVWTYVATCVCVCVCSWMVLNTSSSVTYMLHPSVHLSTQKQHSSSLQGH